ncbi:hypothetical protein EAG_00816 [Camponotus floridanus]|uniref:Uncharacterized protein n=1 Tax=Camponotus floridanus TaxID=104421 RepID=E2AQ52_CAMFO|nr:hypothetical protein EAG_00816 [Camponotus floridanus]
MNRVRFTFCKRLFPGNAELLRRARLLYAFGIGSYLSPETGTRINGNREGLIRVAGSFPAKVEQRRSFRLRPQPVEVTEALSNRTTELFRTVDSSHVVVRLAAVSRTTTLYPPYLCHPTLRADPDVQPSYSPFPLLPLASNPRPPFCPRASQPSSLSYPLCPSPTTECTPPPARLKWLQYSNGPLILPLRERRDVKYLFNNNIPQSAERIDCRVCMSHVLNYPLKPTCVETRLAKAVRRTYARLVTTPFVPSPETAFSPVSHILTQLVPDTMCMSPRIPVSVKRNKPRKHIHRRRPCAERFAGVVEREERGSSGCGGRGSEEQGRGSGWAEGPNAADTQTTEPPLPSDPPSPRNHPPGLYPPTRPPPH